MNKNVLVNFALTFFTRILKKSGFYVTVFIAVNIIFLVGCRNSSSGGNATTADSSLVETPQTMEEDQNTEIDDAMHAPGSRLSSVEAGYFLSRMTYGIREFCDYNDPSVTKKLKYVSNAGIPIGSQEFPSPEYTYETAAPLIEGFGALRFAFITSFFTNQVDWVNTRIEDVVNNMGGPDLSQVTDRPQAFMYINPDAIRWCWNNFYRPPSAESITDVSLNMLYNVVFGKFVRTLIIAHEQVATYEFENEQSWYKNNIIIEGKYAPELLSVRYKMAEKYSPDEINAYYFPFAAGFWIRRSIDGTEELLWSYLKILAKDYDNDWLCRNFQICAPVNNNEPVPAEAFDFKTYSESFAVGHFPINLNETPFFGSGEEPEKFHQIHLENVKRFVNPDATEGDNYYTGYALFEKEYTALITFYSYTSMFGGDNYSTTVKLQTYTTDGKPISELSLGSKSTSVNSSAQRISQNIEGFVYTDKVSTITYKTFLEEKPTGSSKPLLFNIQPNGKIDLK